MDWNAISAMAEVSGAVAVIITLVYLTFQVRQNNKLLHDASAESYRNSAEPITQLLATDREALRVFWSGLESRESLNELDLHQFDAVVSLWFQSGLQTYRQSYHEGLNVFEWGMGFNGAKSWWAIYRGIYSKDFQDYIDEVIKSQSS